SEEGISRYLSSDTEQFQIRVLKSCTSTMTLLREEAVWGAQEGFVIAAESQTAGRGRLGRSFYSPEGTGIYMAILLRPQLPADQAVLITTAAAAAVAEALEALSGKNAGIKWVNDIFMDGKKVCGILTEASFDMEGGGLEYAILGIGVNAVTPKEGFPEELQGIAGAVFEESQADLRNRMAAEILNRFMPYYENLLDKAFLDSYRSRSIAVGQEVLILRRGEEIPAFAAGIDEHCRLMVRYPDGREESLSTGEISLRLKKGSSLA
ncbi:MAG: biotin--[Firmicutes bacterium]|nr:biotin--[acetyl-CoA-carboxylase] ligase [Bacillota bacterium]